ncbi:MAG: PrsW family intramembrane metalloprotease [Euryarchaeota archaeon]|nr:PrsW family intramembrane metalloprotease [Euryarchaeota archaeon]
MAAEDFTLWLIVLLAFAPAFYFLGQIHRERRGGVFDWMVLGSVLLAAALGSAFLAIAFNVAFIPLAVALFQVDADFAGAILVAPVVEEAAKVMAAALAIGWMRSGRHALAAGAAAGLGFAATENLLYQVQALATDGIIAYLATVLVRAYTSMLIHATASAIAAVGLWKWHKTGLGFTAGFLPFYAVAVILHGAFNYVAVYMGGVEVGGVFVALNLAAAIVIALTAFTMLKRAV